MKQFAQKATFKIVLLFAAFLANASISSAQTDTVEYVTYDIIYLKTGGTLKGEILSFDEVGGGIVFKDTYGKTYSLARTDYSYFIQDKVFPKNKKKVEIRSRKEIEYEAFLGISAGITNISYTIKPDDYYLTSSTGFGGLPVSLKLGAGKYMSRQHFIGATADFSLLSDDNSNFNVGLRYLYQYDSYKRNVAFYVPLELQYSHNKSTVRYDVSDTTFIGTNGSYEYPSSTMYDLSLNSVSIGIGQGFSFILENKKSFSIEASIFKNFLLSQSVSGSDHGTPNASVNITGFKLTLLYHL